MAIIRGTIDWTAGGLEMTQDAECDIEYDRYNKHCCGPIN